MSMGLAMGLGLNMLGQGGAAWTPAQAIESLLPTVWYEVAGMAPQSDGSVISSLTDLSANASHAIQNTAVIQPFYKTNILNGYPVARTDANDRWSINWTLPSGSFTIFALVKGVSTGIARFLFDSSAGRLILSLVDDNSINLYTGWYDGTWRNITLATTAWQLLTWRLNAADLGELRRNGTWQGAAHYAAKAISGTTILAAHNNGTLRNLNSDFASLLWYPGVLSVTAMQTVEGYFMQKYGLSVEAPVAPAAPYNGGWTWFSNPRAVYYNGVTYFAGISSDADAVINSVDSNGIGHRYGLHAIFQLDDHANPSILIRNSDKRVMSWYCTHNGSTIYQRVSKNPEDISDWLPETSLDAQLGFDWYTYPCPVQLTGETNEPIYLFFRSWQVVPEGIYYSKSSDGGTTWNTAVRFIAVATQRPYFHVVRNGTDRIDIVCTDGHPNEVPTNSIYHCYYQNGNLYKSNGTLIGAIGSGPYTPSVSFTKVYDGTTNNAWNWDIAVDGSGYPVIAYAQFRSSNVDHRYRYARWNGSSWTDGEVVAGGTYLYAAEAQYSGGICIDHSNVNVVYVSKQVSSQWEIWKYVTADAGATWDAGTAITSGSSNPNIRPVVPQGGGPYSVMWCNGTYTAYTSFNLVAKSSPAYA